MGKTEHHDDYYESDFYDDDYYDGEELDLDALYELHDTDEYELFFINEEEE